MPLRKGPWTIQASNVAFKNEWMEVIADEVVHSAGSAGTFATVQLKHGVSVLAIDENDTVYLTKEYRYAIEEHSVEVVSGAVEANESAEDAAKRELKEELGIVADEWIDFGYVNPLTSQLRAPARLFVARELSFGEPQSDPCESIEMIKMPLDEAIKMVMESKITHAPSGVLILKASQWLKGVVPAR